MSGLDSPFTRSKASLKPIRKKTEGEKKSRTYNGSNCINGHNKLLLMEYTSKPTHRDENPLRVPTSHLPNLEESNQGERQTKMQSHNNSTNNCNYSDRSKDLAQYSILNREEDCRRPHQRTTSTSTANKSPSSFSTFSFFYIVTLIVSLVSLFANTCYGEPVPAPAPTPIVPRYVRSSIIRPTRVTYGDIEKLNKTCAPKDTCAPSRNGTLHNINIIVTIRLVLS